MTIKSLPPLCAFQGQEIEWTVRPEFARDWDAGIEARDRGDNVINMLDVIGPGFDSEGVRAQRISAALRSIKASDIVVNINSPGGSYNEGVAIYEMLRADDRHVTVNVLAMAASAASIIAMAGDDIRVSKSGQIMIHNSNGLGFGDRHDFSALSDFLKDVDTAMAEVYAGQSEKPVAEIMAMMDKTTFLRGQKAIDEGFATDFLSADAIEATAKDDPERVQAKNAIHAALKAHGMSRSERLEIISKLSKGTPRAAEKVTPGADHELIASMRGLTQTLSL
jgi:ATP-dependent Clp protease, protease subunit